MFNIRKIQEDVIYHFVETESNTDITREVVYGKEPTANAESNSDWVKSTTQRLESKFEYETIKKIRMNCQCGL